MQRNFDPCNNLASRIVIFVTQYEVIFFYDRGRIERRFSVDCAIIAVAHAINHLQLFARMDKNHVLHKLREYDRLLCYFTKYRYSLTINNSVKKYSASLKSSCLLSCACLLTRIANYVTFIIIYLLRERSLSDSELLYEANIPMDRHLHDFIRIFYDIQ